MVIGNRRGGVEHGDGDGPRHCHARCLWRTLSNEHKLEPSSAYEMDSMILMLLLATTIYDLSALLLLSCNNWARHRWRAPPTAGIIGE
jgi:hypothetical protein